MSKAKFTVLSGDFDIVARMARLKKILNELGYRVFDVIAEKRRTDLDFVAIDSNLNFDVTWIYPTSKGWIVVRPLVGSYSSRFLKNSMNRLRPVKIGIKTISSEFKMMRSRPMPSGNMWYEWVSSDSRREATILQLPV
jgi:hypothetical protein